MIEPGEDSVRHAVRVRPRRATPCVRNGLGHQGYLVHVCGRSAELPVFLVSGVSAAFRMGRSGPRPCDCSPPGVRSSVLDSFKPYLHERIAASQLNATVLLGEITEMGCTGGYAVLRRYLRRYVTSRQRRSQHCRRSRDAGR